MATNNDQIKYLTATKIGLVKKKYCRFKKNGIKYIDYKDPDYLLKYQRKIGQAIKRARHIAILPYVADLLK